MAAVMYIFTFFFNKTQVFYNSGFIFSWCYLQVKESSNHITNIFFSVERTGISEQQKIEIQFHLKFGVSNLSRVNHLLE